MASCMDFSVLEQFCELLGEEGKKEAAGLVQLYLDDAPKQIQMIEEGIRNNDVELCRRAAHSFKSSSANVGANGLQEICQSMETQASSGSLDGLTGKQDELLVQFEEVKRALTAWASE